MLYSVSLLQYMHRLQYMYMYMYILHWQIANYMLLYILITRYQSSMGTLWHMGIGFIIINLASSLRAMHSLPACECKCRFT